MNLPPDALGSTAVVAEQSLASVARAEAATPSSPSPYGKVHAVPVYDVVAWDLKYIRTRSVGLDLKIIFTTLKYVIVRRGAF